MLFQWKVLAPTILGGLLLVLAGMSLVYFTPLKYAQLVEPQIYDVDAREIYADIQENPEQYDFIDVRDASAYDALHAEGSRHIPLYKMYFERHNLSKDKTTVLICSGGVASGVAYMYLEHFGFRNIIRVKGGIESWQLAQLPIQVNQQ